MPEPPESEPWGGKMGGSDVLVAAGNRLGLLLSGLVLLAGAMTTAGNRAYAQEPATNCAPAVGRLVSLQGNVEVQRAATGAWMPVRRLDTALCAGDRLRTNLLSRALLFLQPETIVRVDQNTTITINQSTDEIEVQFFASELAETSRNTLSRGAGFFITRFPKKFKVSTPHMNAAVEGTEFMVELSYDATKLTVLEGKVSSESVMTRGSQLVTAGQSLQSGPAGPVALAAVVKPQDAVQWVLRYPPISDGSNASMAEELLRAGSVDEALSEIDSVIGKESGNSDAHALRAVIQVAKNDRSGAIESATRATSSDAGNYRAWLAMSYAQQANFDLEAALESALRAETLEPASALANARVAELHLSLGDSRRAEEAARAAVASNAAESHAHSILGFVHLAQINTRAARADFEAAIERDSFSALPRLGLGLAMIRDGELLKGREQIEIAVALDPSNSLLRSYVGKAYYEENTLTRDGLAETQFALAKQLDERDPTPWFYDAIYKDALNQPVHALHELQASIERNDNRAVYRSRLLVDDDAAARTASSANIYENLGFEKLAIVESTRALGKNAGSYSAHRQLAEAYSNLPRYEIARVSEELQAQLRQPVSLFSVGSRLGTESFGLGVNSGPARPGANEFNALFDQNDVRVQFDGHAGNLGTWGDQFVVSALMDKVSFALTQLHYETDGFTDNDAAEKDHYGLVVHGRLSTSSSLQLEVAHSELDRGHTFFAFDEFPTPTTIGNRSDSVRISGFHDFGTLGNWVWSGITEDRRRDVRSFPDGGLFTNSKAKPFALEAEYSTRIGGIELVSGASYIQEVERFELELVDIHTESASLFLYSQWKSAARDLSVLAGVAAEWFEERSFSELSPDRDPVDRSRLSPKLGVVWSPTASTTIRAAAFSAVRRPFIRSQTIEPTQVAGFNQFFTGFERFYGDINGMVSDRVAVALDQALSASLFGGVEMTRREIAVPSFALERDFTWREKTAHAYFYKTFSPEPRASLFSEWDISLSADLEYEKIERPQILTGAEGIMDLKTKRAPFGLRLYSGRGTTVRIETTYIRQEGDFSIDIFSPVVRKEDEAWITDIAIEQRLPRRHGALLFGVRNVLDENIDLVEIDPLNPRVATKRFIYGNIKLVF